MAGRCPTRHIAVNQADPATFTRAEVLPYNTWEYNWETRDLNLSAGTYTVYAVATPSDTDHLSDTEYGTALIGDPQTVLTHLSDEYR